MFEDIKKVKIQDDKPTTLEKVEVMTVQGGSLNNTIDFPMDTVSIYNYGISSSTSKSVTVTFSEATAGFKVLGATATGTTSKYSTRDYITIGDVTKKFSSNNIASFDYSGTLDEVNFINYMYKTTGDFKYVSIEIKKLKTDRPVEYIHYYDGSNQSNTMTYRPKVDMNIKSIKVLGENSVRTEWLTSGVTFQVNDMSKKLPFSVKANDRVKIVTPYRYGLTAFIAYDEIFSSKEVIVCADTTRPLASNYITSIDTKRNKYNKYCTYSTSKRRVSNKKDIKIKAHRGVLRNARISFDSLRKILAEKTNKAFLNRNVSKDISTTAKTKRIINNNNVNIVPLPNNSINIITTGKDFGITATKYNFDYSRCGFRVLGIEFTASRQIINNNNKVQINDTTYNIDKFNLPLSSYIPEAVSDITSITNTVYKPRDREQVTGSVTIHKLITDRPVDCTYRRGDNITYVTYEAPKDMVIENLSLLCENYDSSYEVSEFTYSINGINKTLPFKLNAGEKLSINTKFYHVGMTAFISYSEQNKVIKSIDTKRIVSYVAKIDLSRITAKDTTKFMDIRREIVSNDYSIMNFDKQQARLLTDIMTGAGKITEYTFDKKDCGFRILSLAFDGYRRDSNANNYIQVNNSKYYMDSNNIPETFHKISPIQDITKLSNYVYKRTSDSATLGYMNIKSITTDKLVDYVNESAFGLEVNKLKYIAKEDIAVTHITTLCENYTTTTKTSVTFRVDGKEKSLPFLLKKGQELLILANNYWTSLTAFITYSIPIPVTLSLNTNRVLVHNKVKSIKTSRLIHKSTNKAINLKRIITKNIAKASSSLRKVSKDQILNIDSKRDVIQIIKIHFNIDTYRSIACRYNKGFKTLRKTSSREKAAIALDTIRKPVIRYDLKARTLRDVTVNYYYIKSFNTNRVVINDYNLKSKASRLVSKRYDKVIDTSRDVINNLTSIFKVDSKRFVIKRFASKSNTVRKVVAIGEYELINDLNRTVVNTKALKIELRRNIIKNFSNSIRTMRKTTFIKNKIIIIDSIRRVVKSKLMKYRSFRKINLTSNHNLESKRSVIALTTVMAVALKRKVVNATLKDLNSLRKAVNGMKLDLNLARDVITFKEFKVDGARFVVYKVNSEIDLNRKSFKDYNASFDTNIKIVNPYTTIVDSNRIINYMKITRIDGARNIVNKISKNIDAAKKVTNKYIYLLGSERNVVYGLEQNIDLVRGLYNFYEVNSDLSRKVTVPVEKLRNTLIINFELRHGALYKVNEEFIDVSNFIEIK